MDENRAKEYERDAAQHAEEAARALQLAALSELHERNAARASRRDPI
jgi:hypothetical protein